MIQRKKEMQNANNEASQSIEENKTPIDKKQ